MQIDWDKLAAAFRADRANRDAMIRQHGSVDAWMKAMREQDRAELVRTIAVAAELEIEGGPHAEEFGRMRRHLASELFVGRIADDTPLAP